MNDKDKMKNEFESHDLVEDSVISILEHTAVESTGNRSSLSFLRGEGGLRWLIL